MIETKLQINDGSIPYLFGSSSVISPDGGTVAISAPHVNNSNMGAVYIITEKNSEWVQEAKLTPNDAKPNDQFGCSVSLNTTGNIIVVGAYGKKEQGYFDSGCSYVFIKQNGIWVQHSKLKARTSSAFDAFGVSVSIDGKGDTIAIAANCKKDSFGKNQGAIYIFSKEKDLWKETAELHYSDLSRYDNFGCSVSLNKAGDTLVVGADCKNGLKTINQGVVYIFTKNNNEWVEQAKLSASYPDSYSYFGNCVSVSDDGNIVVIGSPYRNTDTDYCQGAAYVFSRDGDIWSQESKLMSEDSVGGDRFSHSVSISGDGNTIVIGANSKDSGEGPFQGASYVFKRHKNKWVESRKIIPRDTKVGDWFGHSVDVCGDGTKLVVGAIHKTNDFTGKHGSAYIYHFERKTPSFRAGAPIRSPK